MGSPHKDQASEAVLISGQVRMVAHEDDPNASPPPVDG